MFAQSSKDNKLESHAPRSLNARRHLRRIGIGLVSALALSACSTINTKALDHSNTEPQGISYHLPKGYFSLALTEQEGTVRAVIGGSLMVPDPDRRYITKIPKALIANNKVKITVNNKNLIATAKSESDGQLNDILTNAATSFFGLQSGDLDAGGEDIFNKKYAWENFKAAEAEANQFVVRRFSAKCSPTFNNKDASEQFKKDCKKLGILAGMAKAGNLIRIEVNAIKGSVSQRHLTTITGSSTIGECPKNALCYHPLSPVKLTLKVAGLVVDSDIFLIPDKSVIASIPIHSGVFAKQKYDLAFTDGVLTSYGYDSETEIVGAVSLPINILKAVISAPVAALAERQKVDTAEKAAIDATLSNLEAQKKAREFCISNPGQCTETLEGLIGGTTPQTEDAADIQVGEAPDPGLPN